MIFLLNSERVLAEVAELARCHISEILRVKPEVVSVKLELAPGGKIIPEFNVEMPQVGALEREYVQQGIKEVWLGWAKRELIERLAGLSDVRLRPIPEPKRSEDHGAPEEDTCASSYRSKSRSGPQSRPRFGRRSRKRDGGRKRAPRRGRIRLTVTRLG